MVPFRDKSVKVHLSEKQMKTTSLQNKIIIKICAKNTIALYKITTKVIRQNWHFNNNKKINFGFGSLLKIAF